MQQSEAPVSDANRGVPTEIPVLIAGGGPIGLSTSRMLSHHGVRSLLVEQHVGTSVTDARPAGCSPSPGGILLAPSDRERFLGCYD